MSAAAIRAGRTGLYALLASVTMLFSALTSAMMVRRGLGGDWSGVPLPPLAWINTALLVLSSVLLEARLRTGALAAGALFLGGQVVIWRDVVAAASPGHAFFLVFSVLHAAHVIGGLAALRWVRADLARLYWHFLTALWGYLMLLFAVWGNR